MNRLTSLLIAGAIIIALLASLVYVAQWRIDMRNRNTATTEPTPYVDPTQPPSCAPDTMDTGCVITN